MSARHPSHEDPLARVTFWHVIIYVVATAWIFGGRIDWVGKPLMLWGVVGALLTLAGFLKRRREHRPCWRPFVWVLPGLLLGTWILIASYNPNFQVTSLYDSLVYRPIDPIPWLPSAAKPAEARAELWLLMGLYLSAFNIALNIGRLSLLHRLFLVLAINTTVIAVFGTLQKLLGTDMFFGLQKSPNPAFFGSFIYHNHWGPFALLGIGMWLSLIPWLSNETHGRTIWHTPATGAICAVLFIAVAIPLSTSRASTLMLGSIVICTVVHHAIQILKTSRMNNRPVRLQLLLLAFGLWGLVGSVYYIGEDVIKQRYVKTQEQLVQMKEQGGLGERLILYRTTIEIWKERPVAGWGLESWELMHRRRTPLTHRGDRIPIYYDQAHSDWLQSLAEVGAVGTTLLLGMGAVPLWMTRRRLFAHAFSGNVFVVHALILLYAWVEFPLVNPAVVLTFWVTFFAGLRHAQLGTQR